MIVYMVNYRETISPKMHLTRILGIPTYDALHQMELDLKINALYFHSNLRGYTHVFLGLLMMNTKYSKLSNFLYIRPVHPCILLIPNNATHIALYELKQVYDKNIQVFHEIQGVEQALIQQVVTDVDKQFIIAMNNRNMDQFTGKVYQIFVYLLTTYRKFSLIWLNGFEK